MKLKKWRKNGAPFTTQESFEPCGVTTVSQSRILAADIGNHFIHILDQDRQFIHFIVSVISPIGLCVDTRYNLDVAERDECRVEKPNTACKHSVHIDILKYILLLILHHVYCMRLSLHACFEIIFLYNQI